MPKYFLLLQGVSSPFFARLSDSLVAAGQRVSKINFNCGDHAYWRPLKPVENTWAFAEPAAALPAWLAAKMAAHGFTDVVLFGDRRPLHIAAIAEARRCGVRVHVFEEGYFRPHWVTLERGGVNRYSALPREPDWYLQHAGQIADTPCTPIHTPLRVRAAHDIAYHLANIGNAVAFANYRTHRPYNAFIEYAGLAKRFAMLRWCAERDALICKALLASARPFFLLPLQLDSDAQIRDFSTFSGMGEVIDTVIRSFARAASPDAHLLIKNHPLDTGFVAYPPIIQRVAAELAVAGRVHFIETGDANPLLAQARGVVLVNSTVGTAALEIGCPIKTLADPIYNLAGLTFQGDLDRFWLRPQRPQPALVAAFRKMVIHCTMVNGGFYTQDSMDIAARGALRLLTADKSPIEELQ